MLPCIFTLLAALASIGSGQAEQHGRQNKQDQHQQRAGDPAPVAEEPDSQRSQRTYQPCYPNSEIGISCDGIAAKAAVDQARDADKQAALIWWQFAVGSFTLIAAVAAAIFAAVAARHTKRAADAANVANRPWISLTLIDIHFFKISYEDVQLAMTVKIANRGNSPAVNIHSAARVSIELDEDLLSHGPPKCSADLRREIRLAPLISDFGAHLGPGEEVIDSVYVSLDWRDVEAERGTAPSSFVFNLAVAASYGFGSDIGYSEIGARLEPRCQDGIAFKIGDREYQSGDYAITNNSIGRIV